MAWVWSGAADFNPTFASAGVGVQTNWDFSMITLPSGVVTSPLTGAILLFAFALEMSPGHPASGVTGSNDFGANTMEFIIQDNLGTERSAGNGGSYGVANPVQIVFGNATKTDAAAHFGNGGAINLKGWFIEQSGGAGPSSETLTGSIAAAIWDSTDTTERDGFFGSSGSTLPPVTGRAIFSNSSDVFDRGCGAYGGIMSSGSATAGTFTGAASWTDLVAHTNGKFLAGIGDYSGAGGSSTPYRIDGPSPLARFGWSIHRLVHTAAAAHRRRSWGTIVGD